MRTTIDLPDELHEAVLALALTRRQSLSETIAALIRREVAPRPAPVEPMIKLIDGFPTLSIGRPITPEEVKELLDEDS